MRLRVVTGLVVAAFAAALGHLAWGTFFGPPAAPKYFVGGEVRALSGTDPEAKQLYLRHRIWLSQRPRRAWLQVLGRDQVTLFINGKLIEKQTYKGFPVAVMAE